MSAGSSTAMRTLDLSYCWKLSDVGAPSRCTTLTRAQLVVDMSCSRRARPRVPRAEESTWLGVSGQRRGRCLLDASNSGAGSHGLTHAVVV